MYWNTFTATLHDYGKTQCPNSYNTFLMYNFSDLELELSCLLVDRHTIIFTPKTLPQLQHNPEPCIFCVQAASSILLTSHNHVLASHAWATQSFGQSQPADVNDCRTRTRERHHLSPRCCNPVVSSPRVLFVKLHTFPAASHFPTDGRVDVGQQHVVRNIGLAEKGKLVSTYSHDWGLCPRQKKGEKRGNKNVEHIISLIKSYIGEMHNPSLISLVAHKLGLKSDPSISEQCLRAILLPWHNNVYISEVPEWKELNKITFLLTPLKSSPNMLLGHHWVKPVLLAPLKSSRNMLLGHH
jgi:hypothetical protein